MANAMSHRYCHLGFTVYNVHVYIVQVKIIIMVLFKCFCSFWIIIIIHLFFVVGEEVFYYKWQVWTYGEHCLHCPGFGLGAH